MSFIRSKRWRLGFFALGILGALYAPPWIPLLAMIALSLSYPAWEAVAIGFLVDLLWLPLQSVEGATEAWFLSIPLFTLIGLFLLWCLEPLRREFLLH